MANTPIDASGLRNGAGMHHMTVRKKNKRPSKTYQNLVSDLFFDLFLDQLGKCSRVVNTLSIQEHRRRSANTDLSSILDILLDQPLAGCRLTVLFELVHVQPQLLSDLHNFLIVDLIVILEQLAVERPELSLLARGQGCHSALMGIFMIGEWEMLDHIADVVGEFFQQLLDIAL
jgi:hypothetical protein